MINQEQEKNSAVIYKYTNTINNKKYIGFTTNIEKRQYDHINESKKSPNNSYFHKAINKYSIDSFKFEIIETSFDIEYLFNYKEEYWIRETNSYFINGQGYNMSFGGEGNLGYKWTAEQRLQGRNSHIGKPQTAETINKKIIKQEKKYKLTFLSGEEKTIRGLNRWSRENGYDSNNIRHVLSGKHKYHKDIILVSLIGEYA